MKKFVKRLGDGRTATDYHLDGQAFPCATLLHRRNNCPTLLDTAGNTVVVTTDSRRHRFLLTHIGISGIVAVVTEGEAEFRHEEVRGHSRAYRGTAPLGRPPGYCLERSTAKEAAAGRPEGGFSFFWGV